MATAKIRLTACLSMCVLLAFTPALFADSHVRIVRLSDVEGSVKMDRNTGQGFERAIMNMPVTQGMRLETGASGKAEVEFEHGTVLRLGNNSSVDFQQLSLRSDGHRLSDIQVNGGTVYVDYEHRGGDDFRVQAGNETIKFDHDVRLRLRLTGDEARLAVFKGEIKVPGKDGKLAKVKKNETFNLNLNNSEGDELAKGIAPIDTDEWNFQRTKYDQAYASNYNRSLSPYLYGYSDLNYYGNFFNMPGYGTLWRPFGMSTMWDPFSDGAWAFYPGFGYMWVSGYPWGWTPYRYGSWVYVPTYGWAWQPGGWNTWNLVPVVVNAPLGWHHPVPPPSGTKRPTVIVGNPQFSRPARTFVGGPNRGFIPGRMPETGIAPGRVSRLPRPGRNETPATANPQRPTRVEPPRSTNVERPSRGSAPQVQPAPRPAPQVRPAPAPRPMPQPPMVRPAPVPRPSGMSAPMMRPSMPPMRSSAPPRPRR